MTEQDTLLLAHDEDLRANLWAVKGALESLTHDLEYADTIATPAGRAHYVRQWSPVMLSRLARATASIHKSVEAANQRRDLLGENE